MITTPTIQVQVNNDGVVTSANLTLKTMYYTNTEEAPLSTSVTPIDRSGHTLAGGAAQTLMEANTNRKGFWIQNQDPILDLWINEFGGTAILASPCLRLPPQSYYESPYSGTGTTSISIIGSQSGIVYACREW